MEDSGLLAGRCGSSGGIVFDVAGLPTRPWRASVAGFRGCPEAWDKTPSTLPNGPNGGGLPKVWISTGFPQLIWLLNVLNS